jgi:hypothetical protein
MCQSNLFYPEKPGPLGQDSLLEDASGMINILEMLADLKICCTMV